MREIVDRVGEVELLKSAVAQAPSLVVMIGRRRVGKSFLLARTLGDERVVSFQGDEQGEAQHLTLLAEQAGRALIGSTSLAFGTWDDALRFFGEQATRAPLTVVLDEFQWMKSAQPALDSIIQRHWDTWDRDGLPITLVLSGSALTMMEGLLEPGAPLYGRATARPRLQPLDFRDAAAFAQTEEPVELLRRWAVLGGTPQYNVWAGPGNIERVLRERILAKDAPLYDDPRHLLRDGEGIRDPGTYLSILRAVAYGATAHNEIAQQAGVPTGNLIRKMARLEDLGYISPRAPLEPDGTVSRSIYEISDPYFRFWFRYILRNRSRLDSGRVDEVHREVLDDLDNLMGPAFEQCCRAWIQRYASEALTGAPQDVGSWWSRKGDVEIDIVGVRQRRYVLVGAVKWRKIVDTDVLGDVLEQQAALGASARRARLLVFAREGFTDEMRRRSADEGVELLTAADLFA
ncbi:ATP-binding protein [Svornostia abyssi]|uniref:ATP-binding protein n=1 Tax=Svornostia abyssi TaxID=2898438 RepID=A0ABY5PBI9_9ACTN|nr:ATP-binding protein [Parviterribacteraceae bacterium J379]